jgi:hypothetical protein
MPWPPSGFRVFLPALLLTALARAGSVNPMDGPAWCPAAEIATYPPIPQSGYDCETVFLPSGLPDWFLDLKFDIESITADLGPLESHSELLPLDNGIIVATLVVGSSVDYIPSDPPAEKPNNPFAGPVVVGVDTLPQFPEPMSFDILQALAEGQVPIIEPSTDQPVDPWALFIIYGAPVPEPAYGPVLIAAAVAMVMYRRASRPVR